MILPVEQTFSFSHISTTLISKAFNSLAFKNNNIVRQIEQWLTERREMLVVVA